MGVAVCMQLCSIKSGMSEMAVPERVCGCGGGRGGGGGAGKCMTYVALPENVYLCSIVCERVCEQTVCMTMKHFQSMCTCVALCVCVCEQIERLCSTTSVLGLMCVCVTQCVAVWLIAVGSRPVLHLQHVCRGRRGWRGRGRREL